MWSIIDTSVATVQGSARVQSVNLGKTQLICRDHKNFNNWDAIDVEVAQLNKLAWIEEKVEINARPPLSINGRTSELNRGYGEVRVLSLFAQDSKGRKFTNCTAVRPQYEMKGETFMTMNEQYDSSSYIARSKYELINSYVNEVTNRDLIDMRQRFDEQQLVTFKDDLNTDCTPELSQILMLHNNFGICAQQEV